jgi:serine/threonine protein kinase/Tfp pilus assembly protein PilF
MNEEEIFSEALARSSPEERASYLQQACGGNSALRASVEALLRANIGASGFLEGAVGGLIATIDDPISERPGALIGAYKLLEEIGEGGFGVVFMAEQTQPVRRKVALKVLKPGMDTRQVVARFEAERQALAIMDHPNIAKVLDGGATPSGRPYFVMELVKGAPLTTFCDQNHLTPKERLELFVSVCQAVQHAHTKGIIHRDLKPSNVLVSMHDTTPVVKIIDFGVAKALGQELTDKTLFTGFAQMVGTPLYMSPEQAGQSGLDVDTRSDIYSLGVLLYELLTGTTPFDKERFRRADHDEIRRIIREEEPVRPSTRISTLGQAATTASVQRQSDPRRLSRLFRGELDWIVMKALDKDRSRRYESASAFAADVLRYLHDDPVLACPPSRWYRFRKLARRNKRALVMLSVFALAVLVALGSLVVSNFRISAEAEEKTNALEAAKASEQQAVENLKDALAAVDQMLIRVSEERLQFVPQMEPVRRELLQDALKFYQRFLQRRGSDPAVRRETALAWRRMGFLHYQLGDYARADDDYRKAFAMLDEMDAVSPLDAATHSELIYAHIEYSLVLDNQGKSEARQKALQRAAAIGESLVKQFPEVAAYRDQLTNASNRLADAIARREPAEAERVLRRNLDFARESTDPWLRGQTWLNLGTVLAHQGRHAEAEKACRQALPFFEKAVKQAPSRPWLHVGVSMALEQLAAAVDAQGRPQEAEENYRRAIDILDRLARDYPTGPHYRWGQATARFKLASLLRKLQRPEESEAAYRRVVALSDKLAVDFPTLPGYRWTAVDRRRILAEFLAETGRVPEAQQVYDGAEATLQTLPAGEKAGALKGRGHFYARLGQWDRASADFTKAIELGSEDVHWVWYPLAVLHLRGQRTKEYRDLCEQLLKRVGRPEQRFVVIICKLAPNAVADLSRPVQIAEKLVAREPRNAEYLGLLGAALYRKGELEAAAARLEASIRRGPQEFGAHWRKLELAMAYHRLRRGAEARRLFQEVTGWMEKYAPEQPAEGAIFKPRLYFFSWAHRLDLHLLHREAEEVLKQDVGDKS